MTSPGQGREGEPLTPILTDRPAAVGRARRPGYPPQDKADARRGTAGQGWVVLIPSLAALGTCLYRIQDASFWQDEAATLAAVHRSLPQLLRMLGNVDVVHGLYYVLMWCVVRVAGVSELTVRFPSAVAVAVAAGVITAIGRRLVSTQAGLAAGIVFAALPSVIQIGQNARSFALVAALATIASYLLVRITDAGPGSRRGWLVGYAAAIAALGLANFLALLLVPAHAVALAVRLRRELPGQPLPQLMKSWLAAAAVGGLVVTPVVVIGWGQRRQFSWITSVNAGKITQLRQLLGPTLLSGLVLLVIVAAIVTGTLRGRDRLRSDWPPGLTALCIPWLLLPPAMLLAISVVSPTFVIRYLDFCIPAAALLAGTGLAALGRVAGVLALAIVVLLALPQPGLLGSSGTFNHADLRQLSHLLAERARPGDAVYFLSSKNIPLDARVFQYAYPAGYRVLRDVSIGKSAVQSATLSGTNAPAAVIRQRLASSPITRLWVIGKPRAPVYLLRRLGFIPVSRWKTARIQLLFFVRPHRASS